MKTLHLSRRDLLKKGVGVLTFGLAGPILARLSATASREGEVFFPEARWIWVADDPGLNEWVAFRRSFDVQVLSGPARVRVASADKYWLWLNGELIAREGGLKSGPTPRDWYVDEWQVALREGVNQLAVLAWHFGRPGASHRHTARGGLLVEVDFGSGRLVSDSGWKSVRHPAFGQAGGGTSVTLAEQSVDFDARRDLPGWTEPAFADSGWGAAVELGVPGDAPWGRLVPRPIPAWEDGQPSEYVNHGALDLPVQSPVELTGRLPANLQVYPILKVRASAGREIFIQVERDKKRTRYVTREGEQTFEVPAWGNGHFVSYTIPEGVEVLEILYRRTGYAAEVVGRFESSDEALNLLWTKAVRTAQLCLRDSYMDCPDRERSSWPGDAANIGEVTLRGLDRRSDLMFGKAVRELEGWASPAGNLWGAVPTSRFAGSFREFPAQTLQFLGFGLSSYWQHTGDINTLGTIFPAMRRYLLGLWTVMDGVVQHRGPWKTGWEKGVQCWYDWGGNIDADALDQILYFAALGTLQTATKVLGDPDDTRRVGNLREQMRTAFNRRFWQVGLKAYCTPGRQEPPDERVQALAIVTGIASDAHWPDLADRIEESEKCSIYMERFPLEALVLAGRPLDALKRMRSRWASEIASEYSTLPEEFGQNSNHAWGGAAIVILAERLMGVSLIEPGMRKVRFDPPTGLEFAQSSLPSIHGNLQLAFRRHAGGTTFSLQIPKNIEVTVPVERKTKTFGEGTWTVESPDGALR